MPDVMPPAFVTTAAFHPHDLDPVYDAVLHGVAGGLAALFPPIHNPQRPEGETAGEAACENDEPAARS